MRVWVEKAPMNHARSYHAMTSLNGKILVAGGVNYIGVDTFEDVMVRYFNSLSTVHQDFICDVWTLATALKSCIKISINLMIPLNSTKHYLTALGIENWRLDLYSTLELMSKIIILSPINLTGILSSGRRVLSSKLRGPGFKSWPCKVGGQVTIIM